MDIFFQNRHFIYKILEEGRWKFYQIMFVYRNAIKDYLYSGGPRAPNFERKEKNLFSSSLHSLGIVDFFHIHSLTKLTCIKASIYLDFQISISIYEQSNYK